MSTAQKLAIEGKGLLTVVVTEMVVVTLTKEVSTTVFETGMMIRTGVMVVLNWPQTRADCAVCKQRPGNADCLLHCILVLHALPRF
jgi:hypothetical protein